jgi:DNA (cytosine-5)-methyltransferase 1
MQSPVMDLITDQAYYNELDAYPAQWLRNLIAAGQIAPGIVDERSIANVKPADVADHAQGHFFAGIGVWNYALRLAGWPDDRPVWTGSCPCQPFSAAGSRAGTDDPRHLWPEWFRLIRQCRPAVVFGEQVASLDGLAWLDIVQADLEGEGYSVGALDLCAAGFGAPHLRQRLYFVADTEGGAGRVPIPVRGSQPTRSDPGGDVSVGALADAQRDTGRPEATVADYLASQTDGPADRPSGRGPVGPVVHTEGAGRPERTGLPCLEDGTLPGSERSGHPGPLADAQRDGGRADEPGRSKEGRASDRSPGPVNGFWRDAEWLSCNDGKARATQPGLHPLAHGIVGRVGRLRAYGNAIVAPQAAEFIRAYMTINDPARPE